MHTGAKNVRNYADTIRLRAILWDGKGKEKTGWSGMSENCARKLPSQQQKVCFSDCHVKFGLQKMEPIYLLRERESQ